MKTRVTRGVFVSPRTIFGVGALVVVSCAKHSGVGAGPDGVTESTGLERYTGVWLHEDEGYVSSRPMLSIPFRSEAIPSPEVTQAVVTELQSYAKRLSISVEDSVLTVSGDMPGWSLALPLDGSERAVVQESTGFEFAVSLSWRGETPVVHRSFGVGRAIIDAIELTEGGVLVVTRTVRWGRDHSRGAMRRVYVRGGLTDARPMSEPFPQGLAEPEETW